MSWTRYKLERAELVIYREIEAIIRETEDDIDDARIYVCLADLDKIRKQARKDAVRL